MKKWICAMLLAAILLLPAAAMAASISEATMLYEEEDGVQASQTIADAALLGELEGILLRARENPVGFDGEHTMNSTLMCVTDEDVLDFSCATDGSAFITDNATEITYAVDEADMERLWDIFAEVKLEMGVEALDAFEDWGEDDGEAI